MKKMTNSLLVIFSVIIGIIVGNFIYSNHFAIKASDFFNTTENKQDLSKKKALIIYFSLSGNTQIAADQIKQYTNADIVRLEPQTPYPKDYDDYVPVARKQLKTKAYPAIKDNLPNLNQYSVIYVGFPTWWHQPPRIIHTLFRDYDFKNKVIVPFTTSMSDPISKSIPYIKKMAQKDHAKVINGFRYDDNNQELKYYLKKNKLIK